MTGLVLRGGGLTLSTAAIGTSPGIRFEHVYVDNTAYGLYCAAEVRARLGNCITAVPVAVVFLCVCFFAAYPVCIFLGPPLDTRQSVRAGLHHHRGPRDQLLVRATHWCAPLPQQGLIFFFFAAVC